MSLYLKYRPQDFASVVGQTHVVTTLANTLSQNHLSHAYLFCGPRGTGKTSMARIVAKSLNCTNRLEGSAEPCHTCLICNEINQGRLVDLIEIDAASNRGIDEIRDLREKIVFTPTQARAKVYIIDEVHMLTKEAFNALLKTLEEPPDHAYFILATTEAHKIPETIVSRCQQFTFRRIEDGDIANRLQDICEKEGFKAERKALELIAKASHGGLRDAIGLLEQMAANGAIDYLSTSKQLGLSGSVVMDAFAEALVNQNPLVAIELLNQVHNQGASLPAFLEEWITYLRQHMLQNIHRPADLNRYIHWIDLFTLAKQQLSQAIIPQLPLEIAIIRACDFQVTESVPPEGIIAPVTLQTPTPDLEKKEEKKLETKEDVRTINQSPPGSYLPFDLLTVQQKWSDILNAIETPFIKMSLMDGQPVSCEEGTLSLEFNSSTLMDKVENKANQAVLMKVFEDIFGIRPVLKFSVKKITLSPQSHPYPTQQKVEANSASVLEMAEEVFGIETSGQQ